MVFMAMDERRNAERPPAWLSRREEPGAKPTNTPNNTVPAEEVATIRARAKGNLEAMCKQLTLPVPLLLALAAGLMAGDAGVRISGGELPPAFAQLPVLFFGVVAMFPGGPLSFP